MFVGLFLAGFSGVLRLPFAAFLVCVGDYEFAVTL